MKTHDTVKVNGSGDLGINRAHRGWIGKRCTIIRQLKSGLWQVHREDDPTNIDKFSSRNLDLIAEFIEYSV